MNNSPCNSYWWFIVFLGCRYWGRERTCCSSELKQPDRGNAAEIWKVTGRQTSYGGSSEVIDREPAVRGKQKLDVFICLGCYRNS